jgi:hypothetical protein
MKMLVFPREAKNPYQKLLYRAMCARGDTIQYVGLLTFLPQIFLGRLLGYDVFHLHWAHAFLLRSKREVYWHYLLCLKAIKLLGYKLV